MSNIRMSYCRMLSRGDVCDCTLCRQSKRFRELLKEKDDLLTAAQAAQKSAEERAEKSEAACVEEVERRSTGISSWMAEATQVRTQLAETRQEVVRMKKEWEELFQRSKNLCDSLQRCTLLKGESATMDVEKDAAILRDYICQDFRVMMTCREIEQLRNGNLRLSRLLDALPPGEQEKRDAVVGEPQWPANRKLKNGTRVRHLPSGKIATIDGVLSNCPGTYCLDFGDGTVGVFGDESKMEVITETHGQ